ncbi:MAG: chromate efflux transporter [Kiloniellales bacterium]
MEMEPRNPAAEDGSIVGVGFGEAFRTWLKIGLLSFGGPAGQIAMMHRILVEEKRWIGEERFLHALNFCMLLPGPEAQQLTVYVGWLLHRTLGGLVAGILFVLPGALVMLALSLLYAGFQELTAVQAIFYGIKTAVLAIVIEAVLRIGRRALRHSIHTAIAGAAFVAIFFLALPFPLIILAAALVGLVGARLAPRAFTAASHGSASSTPADAAAARAAPAAARRSFAGSLAVPAFCALAWLAPLALLALLLGGGNVFVQLGLFFSKMAVVTFGGAYAVLAYVAQAAVETYGWLAPGEMLDGLGLAETTPGPLIMVVQFVGFLGAYRNPGVFEPWLAGSLGALVATWVTFAPCLLWIFLGAPYIETLRGNRHLSGALSAITAAVVGVILNLALWFALHVVFGELQELHYPGLRLLLPVWGSLDPFALLLAVAALVAMLRFKLGMVPTLAAAALLGALIFTLRGS